LSYLFQKDFKLNNR